MLCNECKTELRSWVRSELTAAHASRIEQHIASCSDCSIAAHNEQAIHDSLRVSQAVPAPSSDFEQRVLGAAGNGGRARKGSSGHGWSTPVAGGAVAAAMVVGVALGLGWKSGPESDVDLAISGVEPAGDDKSVAADPVARNVRLAFSSREALEGVTLTVELPPHVEVSNYPGHQMLSWEVDLDKGDNVVNLPLNILFPGEGELVARLDDGRRTKTFRTSLEGTEVKRNPEPSS